MSTASCNTASASSRRPRFERTLTEGGQHRHVPCQKAGVPPIIGIDSGIGRDLADAVELPSRNGGRKIRAREGQCVLDPDRTGDQSRHHQEQRIARPLLVPQQAVEFRIGTQLGRGQVRSLAGEQRREDLPARRHIVDRRQLHRLRRVEQRGGRTRAIVLAVPEHRSQPADLPLRLALQQQHPQGRPAAVERGIDKLTDPVP
jgi:hypothetical protein